MLTLNSKTRIFLCVDRIDMRKSFDGLIGVIRNHLKGNPLEGDWFVFLSKTANKIKILYWAGDGYIIFYKRLEQGTFHFPKKDGLSIEITRKEFYMILEGLEFSQMKQRRRYGRDQK